MGTLFQGNQPHPANLPPGVWYSLKPSPSPTLVTWPKMVLFRKYDGEMLTASGKRRRYRRWICSAPIIPVVRIRVGIRVLGSVNAAQSIALSDLSQFFWFCSSCLSRACDSEAHGGHRMTAHAPRTWCFTEELVVEWWECNCDRYSGDKLCCWLLADAEGMQPFKASRAVGWNQASKYICSLLCTTAKKLCFGNM